MMDFTQIALNQSFKIGNFTTSSIYLQSNGWITFESGTNDYSETLSKFKSQHSIAVPWEDRNFQTGDITKYWV